MKLSTAILMVGFIFLALQILCIPLMRFAKNIDQLDLIMRNAKCLHWISITCCVIAAFSSAIGK